jgi:pre-rRNA-processing protein TSR4
MPTQEDDWSDSDQEELSDVETPVLLGVPDGPIEVEADDMFDAAVSRIGGLPVRAFSYV